MKVLHLLVSGEIGGIEVLIRNYSSHSKHENIFLFLWKGGEIAEEMKRDGRDVRIWDINHDGMLRTLSAIARMCRKEHVDAVVMHHNAPFFKIVILWLKLFGSKIATIAYKHDAEEEKAPEGSSVIIRTEVFLKKKVQKWGFSSADGIVAISEYVKKSIVRKMRIPEEKIRVLYNGVSLSEFQAKVREPADAVRLIYVGRLTKDKGVQNIIPALKKVSERYPITMDIIGDGAYRKALEKMSEKYGLNEIIHFRGACRDVPQRLASADIFIHMPEWEEGFGITVAEALAAGCLCVCAAKGGIPEIIRDGIDGILVQSASADELEDILLGVIPKYLSGNCRQMQDRAVSRSCEFTIQNYAKKFDQYLEQKQSRQQH